MKNSLLLSKIGLSNSESPEETEAIGSKLATMLSEGDVVCAFGDLGLGKTTLIKGIIKTLCPAVQTENIVSPTFNYLNIYEGQCPIYHFDLYRLHNERDFFSMGFEEYLGKGICLIEWPERILSILSKEMIYIDFSWEENSTMRRISIYENV